LSFLVRDDDDAAAEAESEDREALKLGHHSMLVVCSDGQIKTYPGLYWSSLPFSFFYERYMMETYSL
jgi:hypothetical protein